MDTSEFLRDLHYWLRSEEGKPLIISPEDKIVDGREGIITRNVAAISNALSNTWDNCVLVLEKVYYTEKQEDVNGLS